MHAHGGRERGAVRSASPLMACEHQQDAAREAVDFMTRPLHHHQHEPAGLNANNTATESNAILPNSVLSGLFHALRFRRPRSAKGVPSASGTKT